MLRDEVSRRDLKLGGISSTHSNCPFGGHLISSSVASC